MMQQRVGLCVAAAAVASAEQKLHAALWRALLRDGASCDAGVGCVRQHLG